jgi:hypothetical protein
MTIEIRIRRFAKTRRAQLHRVAGGWSSECPQTTYRVNAFWGVRVLWAIHRIF